MKTTKIIFKVLFVLFCVAASTMAASAWVEPRYDFKVGDVLYRISSSKNKTVEICGFDFQYEFPLTKDITVPSYVSNNGTNYKVVGTGDLILMNDHTDPEITDDEPWVTQFYNWRYPAHLTLPSTLEYMNKKAFEDCDRLESINFNNCLLEVIPTCAFNNTASLNKIILPNNLKRIEESAFGTCGIEDIRFPEGIEEIGNYAFSGGYLGYDGGGGLSPENTFCLLKEIILPNSLMKLGIKSFSEPCRAEHIVLSNSLKEIPDKNYEQPLKVKEIIIPNSVSAIGKDCFRTTTEFITEHRFEESVLESLTLGKNLKTIGEGAFGEIPNLKSLYCLSDTPPTFVFDKANPQATVYVPKNRTSIYKNDPQWGKHFKNFIELPDILIQFQLKDYTMKPGERLSLRYIVSLFNNFISISEEWSSSSPDGLMVENGVAHAYKSGEYIVKYKITDSLDNTYEASCNVNVEQGSGISSIYDDDDDIDLSREYSIYDLNGLIINSDLKELPHGIYIIKQNLKSKKIKSPST